MGAGGRKQLRGGLHKESCRTSKPSSRARENLAHTSRQALRFCAVLSLDSSLRMSPRRGMRWRGRAVAAAALALAALAPSCRGQTTPLLRCGTAPENSVVVLACPANPPSVIASLDSAFYGTPSGACGAYAAGACNQVGVAAAATAACVGQRNCTLLASNGIFGDPCSGTVKVRGWKRAALSCVRWRVRARARPRRPPPRLAAPRAAPRRAPRSRWPRRRRAWCRRRRCAAARRKAATWSSPARWAPSSATSTLPRTATRRGRAASRTWARASRRPPSPSSRRPAWGAIRARWLPLMQISETRVAAPGNLCLSKSSA